MAHFVVKSTAEAGDNNPLNKFMGWVGGFGRQKRAIDNSSGKKGGRLWGPFSVEIYHLKWHFPKRKLA